MLPGLVYPAAPETFDVEFALNFVWLTLAVASFLLAGIDRLSSQRRDSYIFTAAALICISCVLFPFISVTDDLNNSPALYETGKSKRSLIDAPLLAAPALLPQPGTAMRQATLLLLAEIAPSREQSWLNLDRRPPPQRS